jgi:hypothetical protein
MLEDDHEDDHEGMDDDEEEEDDDEDDPHAMDFFEQEPTKREKLEVRMEPRT